MVTNHYNPSFQLAVLRDRPNAWDCIPAAYEAAGIEPPAKPTTRILDALATMDAPSDILDTLEADFINGRDEPEQLEKWRQAWLAATFHEAASKRLHAAQNTVRTRRATEAAIATALKTLAPEVDALAARLTDAARKLHPATPLDQLAAHETGTLAEVGQVYDIAAKLSAIASLHDSPTLPSEPGIRNDFRAATGLLKFLPLLDLPRTGYPEPSTVQEVAEGVGIEPHEGHAAVMALIADAGGSADELLVNVARGHYPGVTIRLAQNPQELAKRIQRTVDAVTGEPYTRDRAMAHRQAMFVSAGQPIEEWAALVIAHHAGTAPELVTRQRSMPVHGARR